MSRQKRVMSSPYMQWAKGHVHAKYHLASSGVMNYPLSKLPVKLDDLEITGESYYGYEPLQEALARHCGVEKSQVFAALGTSFANHIAMATLVEPGDEVLIEDPTYELITTTAQYLGGNVKRFPRRMENEFRIDPEEIRRKITSTTRLIVLTNLHNPTSAYTDEETLLSIGKVARKARARVLVDEVYLDAAYDRSLRSAVHLGKEFVVTGSLTKAYGLNGLRCGWVLAEPDLVRRMWLLNDLFLNIPPHAAERLSVIALRNIETIRDWAQTIVTKNRKALLELFVSRNDVDCFFPGKGTVVFPRWKNGNVEKLEGHLMQHYQTSIAPGEYFGMPSNFRVGCGGDPAMFHQGLHNLCRALDDLR